MTFKIEISQFHDPNYSKNYRPVSLLPVVSKVFEKIMHDQISQYINNFLTPYLCGYRKGFSTQQALLSLIEKWKIVLDSKGYGGAVIMDLSKTFDTINHDHQTACLWIFKRVFNINKRLVKQPLAKNKS